MSDLATHRSTFGAAIFYRDPRAALEWLERAFGFETTMLLTDEAGSVAHSEMSFGNGYIMVGAEWVGNITWEDPAMRSVKAPTSVGGANTQRVSVGVSSAIDAHCERARAAGAKIVMEPNDQPYGSRVYLAIDPEGHTWDFEEPREAAPDAMEQAGYVVGQVSLPSAEQTVATFFPDAYYKDARAAFEWLERAFGFEPQLIIESEEGQIRGHLGFGDCRVAVSSELHNEGWPARLSPLSVDGANTQMVHVQLTEDIDAHCEKARAAMATILAEPETQFYGDRTYRALDSEGHMWTFAQTVKSMTQHEWAAASGLKVSNSL